MIQSDNVRNIYILTYISTIPLIHSVNIAYIVVDERNLDPSQIDVGN